MFEGEKTRIFWWGLVISAACLCILFTIGWYFFVINAYFDWRYWVPQVFGSIVFLLVGLYMMKAGVRKASPAKPN